MRIHIVSPPSTDISLLIDKFRQRGDVVTHSATVPADADLYLICAASDAIKHLAHGLVVADLRHAPVLEEEAGWLPYADLCLVRNPSDQTDLIRLRACEPERIYPVPDDNRLLDLLDKALQDKLPPAEFSEAARTAPLPGISREEFAAADSQVGSEEETMTNTRQIAALAARLEVAERQSDVMLRDYQVHSKAPLVGPLIAWVRRNLTSHLREPYLDPTLEHQVALNRELVKALRDVLPLLTNLETRLAQLEEKDSDDR